jgi:hypothetical protein
MLRARVIELTRENKELRKGKEMDDPTKMTLFEIAYSHYKLAKEEYKRNPKYNNTHYSFIAEANLSKFFISKGILKEFLDYVSEREFK